MEKNKINEINSGEFGEKAKELKKIADEYSRKFRHLSDQLVALHNDFIHEFRIKGKFSGNFHMIDGDWECSIKKDTLWRRLSIWWERFLNDGL